MLDAEIRKSLHNYLKKENINNPETVIVDEFNVCKGLARVDVAVINGIIHGYEIKSENDTLQRLPNQIKYYIKSLEKVTISINECHLEKTLKIIPDWWGIIIIDNSENVNEIRRAELNISINAESTLQLLWKDELIELINKYRLITKYNLPKAKLHKIITYGLEKDIVLNEVRQTLKLRKNWCN